MIWKQASFIPVGTTVRLRGHKSRPGLNGKKGTLIALYDRDTGACSIQLWHNNANISESDIVNVKPKNLVPLYVDDLTKFWLIRVYDSMTKEERLKASATMDKDCHVCGQCVEYMARSVEMGYTRLICHGCCVDRIDSFSQIMG